MPRRSAKFTWDDGAETHELAYQLLDVRPAIRRRSWSTESISAAIATTKGPDIVHEITARIRFERDPARLLDLLSERIGQSVTYIEVRDGLEFVFPCLLAAVGTGDDVGIDPDPQRASHGEYSAVVRLRRIDGGTFEAVLTPLDPVYLVDDGMGGYEVSDQEVGALVWIDDGGGGLELADAGVPGAVMLANPSDGGVSFYSEPEPS